MWSKKRSLVPTALGQALVGLVKRTEEKHKDGRKADLFGQFYREMETRLDAVEEGQLEWSEMIGQFYPSLLEWMRCA